MDHEDIEAEHERLTRSYRRAVGQALEYRIKVYHPGGQMKDLGTLRDEIAMHEGRQPESVFLGYLADAFERAGRRCAS